MDDIVAVLVRDSKGVPHYFITWGRIFDRVDPEGLEATVTKHASNFGIARIKSVTVCDSLQQASSARYFHEALFQISQEKIPFGQLTYSPWLKKMKKSMQAGGQLYYCGSSKNNPNHVVHPSPTRVTPDAGRSAPGIRRATGRAS